jgi:uncharacterized integral membrane protein
MILAAIFMSLSFMVLLIINVKAVSVTLYKGVSKWD